VGGCRFFVGLDVHDGREFHLRGEQVPLWHHAVPLSRARALSIQITLELPSITVLTKCDLIKEKEKLEKYLDYFSVDHNETFSEPYEKVKTLYGEIRKVIDNNDIVSLRPLNLKDEDSIRDLLL
jgi:hypothetical protein